MVKTRVVAKALVFDKDHNFLRLTRGASHPALAGKGDIPGGMVEPGEEPGAAVIREIREETGLIIWPEDIEVLYTVTMRIGNTSYPTLLYKVQISESKPSVTLSYEHEAFSWEPLKKLAEIEPQLAPTYRNALMYLRENEIIAF